MRIRILFLFFICSFAISCTHSQTTGDAGFLQYFKPLSVKDTVLFSLDSPKGLQANPIPYQVFLENVDTELWREIEYIMEEEGTEILGLAHFPIDKQHEAYIVGLTYSWFGNTSLLIMDKRTKRFIDLVPVAEFYGGDGGQVLRNTWCFDADKNGTRDLVVRDSNHSLVIDENGDQKDVYEEFVSIYILQPKGFVTAEIADSNALIKQFPVDWNW